MAGKKINKIKGPCLVVEPGGHWLKVLRIEPGRGASAVTLAWLKRFDVLDAGAAQALAALVKQHKLERLPILACLPRQAVTVRMLDLPSTESGEINDMVELQAAKQTPYSRDQILYDYRIVGGTRAGYTRILLAIVQRDVLRYRFSLLEDAGLSVEQMTVSSEGLLNWYLRNSGSGDRVTALLDIDAEATDLCVMRGDVLLFNRSIKIGAEALLETSGEQVAERFVQETAQTLEACRREVPGTELERIMVTGACGGAAVAAELLKKTFEGVTVEINDSTATASRWPADPDLHAAPGDRLAVTALLGMALDPGQLAMGFVPEPVRLRRDLLTKARSLSTIAVLVISLLVTASMAGTLRLWRLKNHYNALNAEITQNLPEVARVEQQREVVLEVHERRNSDTAVYNMIIEAYRHLLPEVYVEAFAVDSASGEITLEGLAESRRDIRSLVEALESSELFTDVRESGTSARDKDGRYTFKVVCPRKGAVQ